MDNELREWLETSARDFDFFAFSSRHSGAEDEAVSWEIGAARYRKVLSMLAALDGVLALVRSGSPVHRDAVLDALGEV